MTRYIRQNNNEAPDGRRTAAAASRNVDAIIESLRDHLPVRGRVLELASGTGQHVAAFAAAFPDLDWMPSDIDPQQLNSIAAWRRECGQKNLAKPLAINIAEEWPIKPAGVHVVLTINLFHLVPETAVSHFFRQAQAALNDEGQVIIYGPFLRGSTYASEGDRQFDASLRSQNPVTGYKSVEAVYEAAINAGFAPVASDAMPANNLLLCFAKSAQV